jgi:hypothetical protein
MPPSVRDGDFHPLVSARRLEGEGAAGRHGIQSVEDQVNASRSSADHPKCRASGASFVVTSISMPRLLTPPATLIPASSVCRTIWLRFTYCRVIAADPREVLKTPDGPRRRGSAPITSPTDEVRILKPSTELGAAQDEARTLLKS